MFGWELPPYNSGGLGTACLGLTEGLAPLGVSVDFVVPKVFGPLPYDHMRIHSAVDFESEFSLTELAEEERQALAQHILAYGAQVLVKKDGSHKIDYSTEGARFSPGTQSNWYARRAAAIAKKHSDFDLIHCHDWMTYQSGITAKQVSAKKGKEAPLVAHIHATEIDRCGQNGNQEIIALEKHGMQAADRVVAVSHYTKKMVHEQYDIPLEKISVVHNGIPSQRRPAQFDLPELKKHFKLVLFMGRVTMQKGPDYFIRLAKSVCAHNPKVKFIMVGSGDMERRCIEQAAASGLTGKILFSSFLRGSDVDKAYQLADIFVMPSVSEPFGIVALEAMQNGTPVLASKQSGVAEVSTNLWQADFWDTPAMTEIVLKVLRSPKQRQRITAAAKLDLNHLTWADSAQTLQGIYQQLLASPSSLTPSFTLANSH